MQILKNAPLAPFTTVKIGGPADTLIITDNTSDFVAVLKDSMNASPPLILGNGSNVLIADSGIRSTVIKNTAGNIEYLPDNMVKVDSGVQLPQLILDTINHSLSGLEEFTYIPSTIGGAIYGNIHGVNKNDFNLFLQAIEIFNLKTGQVENLDPKNLAWSYDTSEFKSHPEWIILSATLKLNPGQKEDSLKLTQEITAKKILTQSMNSLGSTFKNPENDSAGRIIDQELNLKGFRLGDAQISPKHGNFILNLGKASAADYKTIIDHVQKTAKDKLNLDLEPEIIFWGDFKDNSSPTK